MLCAPVMDAVELPLPAPVAVPKLMGSEGFGRVGVSVKGVEARENDRVSILVGPSIERCSSLVGHKDATIAVNTSESVSWDKIPHIEICRRASQMACLQGEDAPEHLSSEGTNSSSLLIPGPEGSQLPRKAGKIPRSSGLPSGCFKRPRTAQTEDSTRLSGADDMKGISSYPTKCTYPEKSQVVRQKNNFNGKRGEKRNFKVPTRTKYDSFSLKAGLTSFSSAGGGNSILGIYGLKSDIHDVTKLVDEISVNRLLDGTYKCPSLGKDKGKKAVSTNENILHSVRKACSLLQLRRPVQSQQFSETDCSSNRKLSTSSSNSFSCVASNINGDKGDAYRMDLSSCYKDSCSKPETPFNMLDFSLHQPKDILERLALPPPKDLESLLLDAVKPAGSSKSTPDQRLGKPISHRANLPPFPWAHTFSGHCKTNSDAVKLSTSRSTCQGRWQRIGSTAGSLGDVTDCFKDLESFTYDQSLVPSQGLKLGVLENEVGTSASFPLHDWCPSSSTTCSKASHLPPESAGSLKNEGDGGHSPILIEAAQTLFSLAAHSLRQHPNGIMKWPKKSLQKPMKARKTKSNERPEHISATKSVVVSDYASKNTEQITPSKKPKLCATEKKKDFGHSSARKGLINWSTTPRSIRSSPSKSVRDPTGDSNHHNASITKQSCMLPPPTRILDKAGNSQQKPKRPGPVEWSRAGDKLD